MSIRNIYGSKRRQAELDWIVYILHCADDTLYTGMTNNLEKRLAQHSAGLGAKYTKGRGPFAVRYVAHYATRSEALKAEAAIKSLSRLEKIDLIKKGLRHAGP